MRGGRGGKLFSVCPADRFQFLLSMIVAMICSFLSENFFILDNDSSPVIFSGLDEVFVSLLVFAFLVISFSGFTAVRHREF
jgi:hypothetical protein